MRKKLAEMRRTLISLKRQVKSLTDSIALIKKSVGAGTLPKASADVLAKSRLNGKAIARLRKKLGLSRRVFGKLIDASQNTILLWEAGKTVPRSDARAKLIMLRKTGKREVKRMIKGMGLLGRKPRKGKKASK